MALAVPDVFGKFLTNIIIAILILLIGFVAGRILGSILHKAFSAAFSGRKIRGKKSTNLALAKGAAGFVSLCIYIASVIFALEQLGITLVVLKTIFVIAMIIIAGAIFFAIIDFTTNLYYGISILTSGKIEKNDLIKIKKIEGKVKHIGLAHTQLITSSGERFVISNKLFFKNKFSREKENKQ